VTLVALIDPNACIAHGDCEELAPGIFRVEDGLSVAVGDGPDELMLAAAEACPTNAIRIIERETRRQRYP
jgi:ferredoxin